MSSANAFWSVKRFSRSISWVSIFFCELGKSLSLYNSERDVILRVGALYYKFSRVQTKGLKHTLGAEMEGFSGGIVTTRVLDLVSDIAIGAG